MGILFSCQSAPLPPTGQLLAAALIAIIAYGFRDQLLYAVIKRGLAQSMIASIEPDTFEVHFCGTGIPRFSPHRNQSCLLVIAGSQVLLFDAGQNALWSMEAMKSPWMHIDTIFLTHLHSDHISGVGEVIQNGWAIGRRHAIDVFGPPQTRKVIDSFRALYEPDIRDRSRTLGYEDVAEAAPHLWGTVQEIAIRDEELHTVYNRDGVTVNAFLVDHLHWEPSYGYRVEYKNKVLVLSGDTRPTERIVQNSSGADVLVHEAFNLDIMKIVARASEELSLSTGPEVINEIANAHTDTKSLASIAERAQVKKLFITHLIPPIPPNAIAEAFFIKGMSNIYKGKITVARDGMRVHLLNDE